MIGICQFGAGRIGAIHASNVAAAGARLVYVVDVNQDAAAALAVDADNRLLWRHSPRRLDAESLARALSVLQAGFAAVESQLQAEPWYRPQAPALRHDLSRLPAMPAPDAVESPVLATPVARLGAAYVLIGSRLGAKSIARRLRETLGPEFVAGSSYYGAEAEHAPEQWGALQQRLAAAAPESADEACAAARAAFGLLIGLSERAIPA